MDNLKATSKRGQSANTLTAAVLLLLTLAITLPPGALADPRSAASDGAGLPFELSGVSVGVAEYEDGPTGATVIAFDHPVKAAVDVRGGAPGTINTDALRLGYDEPFVNAITLAGGSSYGLSVATGVANAIKDKTPNAGAWDNVPTVLGAIIFDLGGRRYTTVSPDEALGRAALAAARRDRIPLGASGAGRFAMTGYYFDDMQHSGQGAAIRKSGAVKVLVVTIVNALGSVVDRSGRIVRCGAPGPAGCPLASERLDARLAELGARANADTARTHAGLTANTTITAVITNEALPVSALQRLAVQVHNSMGRAIQPFGTEFDGDTLFAASTGEIPTADGLKPVDLGVLASETAWDAVLASQPPVPAKAPATRVALGSAEAMALTGRFEFAPGARATVGASGASLWLESAGAESVYLHDGVRIALKPVGRDLFELQTQRADVVRFERDGNGRVRGITLNPGPWPIRALRAPDDAPAH
jgi:L-aminopeptidase/D-esterase-like protein